jgi:pimeloyl-ACP methyl ester carboxylesterase
MTDRSVICYGAAMTSFFETSTGPVAYDERGSRAAPAGETILMLPSGAHERSDYDEPRALLPERVRTIALDWPAHGDSPAGSGDGGVLRLAGVAEEALAGLAPEGAVVLGNSVGGFAAARAAIRRPDLVRGLVIVDGGGFQAQTLLARLFCALMSRRRFLRAIYPAFSASYMRSHTPADRRARALSIATTRRADGLRTVAELWGSFTSPEHDLRADASAIAAPTLILWGRKEPVIPVSVGRDIETLIPGSRLAVLDTGHVPHTSDPDGFAGELLGFLGSLQSAERREAA